MCVYKLCVYRQKCIIGFPLYPLPNTNSSILTHYQIIPSVKCVEFPPFTEESNNKLLLLLYIHTHIQHHFSLFTSMLIIVCFQFLKYFFFSTSSFMNRYI